jgi:hypothetical protein
MVLGCFLRPLEILTFTAWLTHNMPVFPLWTRNAVGQSPYLVLLQTCVFAFAPGHPASPLGWNASNIRMHVA